MFPAVITVVLGLLARAYSRPGRIEQIFERYARPPWLKRTIGLWMIGIAAVFGAMQWLRWPYYVEFLSRLTHIGARAADDPLEAVIVFGLLVMLACEWIVVMHWAFYLFYSWMGSRLYKLPERTPLGSDGPEVVVLIACCNEEPDVLERSLETVTQLRYPRMRTYLVENSRDLGLKAQAAQMAAQYGVEVLHVRNRGHKAGAMNDAMALLKPTAPYVSIIDADQRVHPDFLMDLIPLLERDPELAFIQTPQLYSNAEETWVCRATEQQEMLLYDTIMEAKSTVGEALCCGTNFVMRRRALEDAGGWDERSISEDLMTSFLIRNAGWKSLYVRRPYVKGLGPLDITSYWKQQKRWASGNTTVVRLILRALFRRKPKPAALKHSIGYLWSAGFYIAAMALAGLAALPILLLIASYLHAPHALQPVPGAQPNEWLFLSVYPFYAVVMLYPYVHMRMRGYPVRNLIMVQGLLAVTLPVYVGSVLKGLFTHQTFFEIASKKLSEDTKARLLGPQAVVLLIALTAGSLLTHNILTQPHSSVAWVALFWIFFYTISFSHYFLFVVNQRRAVKRAQQARAQEVASSSPTHVEAVEAE